MFTRRLGYKTVFRKGLCSDKVRDSAGARLKQVDNNNNTIMASKQVCFLFCLLGLVQMCRSLTCNPLTLNSCTKSLYVTGNCVAGECECVSGTIPNTFGCVKPTKPTVSVKIDTGYGEIDQDRWSQEGSPGYYDFICSPKIEGRAKYKWFRNGVDLKTSGYSKLTIYVSASTWRFQCALDVDGLADDKSDPFVITVNRYGERFTTKPEVTGIPKFVALNAVFKVYCSKIPSFLGAFVFNINGNEQREIFPETYVNMTADTFGKTVTCSVRPESQTWSVTSDPATLPSTPATDIPEVVIVGERLYYTQQSMTLTCVFKDSFAPENGVPVKYEWTGPAAVTSNTAWNYYKHIVSGSDAGQYKCHASYQNQTAKISPGFDVSVENLGGVSLLAKPEKPVIGGYMSLTCSPTGTSPSSPLYTWDILPPYTDNVIQVNAIDTGDMGQWMSCDFKTRGGKGNIKYISVPLPMSDIPPPTIEGTSKSNNHDLYTMKCNSEYGTPGAIVEWYVNDVKEDKENSSSFIFFQDDFKNGSVIRCRLSFDSKYSEFSENATIPKRGFIEKPVIRVRGFPTQSFISGASFTILCSSVTQVKATYSWKKNGVSLNTNNHWVMLQGIDNSTNGNYTCAVTLRDEVEESEPFEIVVQDHIDPPVIEVVGSSFQGDHGDLKLLETGHTYYLRCSTPAHSELARYSWKTGSKYQNVPDNIIRLHNVGTWDTDLYSCEISSGNAEGKSTGTAIVVGEETVLVPKVEVNNNPKSFIGGGNYTFVCVNSRMNLLGSITNFTWEKDNAVIHSATGTTGQVLKLTNIQDKDKGSYKCTVNIGTKQFKSENAVAVSFSTTGMFCASDKDCLGKGKTLSCQGGVCKCESGVIFDGKKCLGNSVTYSVLLLVLALICFKSFHHF